VHQQASYRADGTNPDLETYMLMRHETSGCKPVFDLIEYSLDLELPEEAVEHPIILALNQSTCNQPWVMPLHRAHVSFITGLIYYCTRLGLVVQLLCSFHIRFIYIIPLDELLNCHRQIFGRGL
jgi:hypothetical protein